MLTVRQPFSTPWKPRRFNDYSLDWQLCHWLLWSSDRLEGREPVTIQEPIANMIGMGHEGVTESAPKLQGVYA